MTDIDPGNALAILFGGDAAAKKAMHKTAVKYAKEEKRLKWVHAPADDFGESWTSIVGDLPAESVNVIQEDPELADVLYVGTDLGVFVSGDGGGHWHSLSTQLPTTPVHDLDIHPREGELVIGTHGRSVFVLDLAPVREWFRGSNDGR